MKIYGVYDKDEQCRFVGNINELVKEFNCDCSAVTHAVRRGSKRFMGKYKVVVVYEEGDE